jgi:hypothetical protein
VGKGGFAEPRRSVEERVVERFPPLPCGADLNRQVFFDPCLADDLGDSSPRGLEETNRSLSME